MAQSLCSYAEVLKRSQPTVSAVKPLDTTSSDNSKTGTSNNNTPETSILQTGTSKPDKLPKVATRFLPRFWHLVFPVFTYHIRLQDTKECVLDLAQLLS